MVDQRFERGVILATDQTLGPLVAVRHLVFNQVAFVDRLKAALIAAVELTRVFPHMCVQIACRQIVEQFFNKLGQD